MAVTYPRWVTAADIFRDGRMLDRFVQAQTCPTCGAEYGEPCVTLRGHRHPVASMHIRRYYAHWDAWKRMHGETV